MNLVDCKYYLSRVRNTLKSYSNDLGNFFIKLNESEFSRLEEKIKINRLYFEVTNICNAACTFCAYRKISKIHKEHQGTMELNVFKKALDDFLEMGGKNISLTPTIGEPLIDKGIFDKIDYAVNVKYTPFVYFYTNGILLKENDNYKKIINGGVNKIGISTQGCDEKLFEEVYNSFLYKNLIIGIGKLLEYNKKKGEPVEISIDFRSANRPSFTLNSSDFNKFIRPFLSEKVKYSFMADYDNWGGAIIPQDLKGIMKMRRVPKVKSAPCRRTFDAAILYDGSVRLCACRIKDTEFDDLVVGNIRNDSLDNIYNSEKTKAVRRKFIDSNLPDVCSDCSLYMPAGKKWLNLRAGK